MANQLALANISGVGVPNPPSFATPPVGGLDRNASRVYERERLLRYSLTLSGLYVQAVRGTNVGEVIDLTKPLVPAQFQSNQFWSYKGPVRLYVINQGSNGNGMVIIPGADAYHWILKVFSGVGTELAAGAYPAGLLADLDIVLEATGLAFD